MCKNTIRARELAPKYSHFLYHKFKAHVMEDKTRAKTQLEPQNWHQCTKTCVQISVLVKLIPFEEE